MIDKPSGVSEQELRRALDQGWALRLDELHYAPVGAGSYHWTARDHRGDRWFVTVDDLDDKSWLGDTRPQALAGLRGALDTAGAPRPRARPGTGRPSPRSTRATRSRSTRSSRGRAGSSARRWPRPSRPGWWTCWLRCNR